MKRIKRISILLMWVVLIFSILYFPVWIRNSPNEKTLNIFSWGDVLDPAVVAEFEKQTGIKVRLNYYSSNEELLVKLKATRGFGYDLIIPSDYAVKILAEEGLLKKIDKSKLDFLKHLNPLLLDLEYDRGNNYSIPFEWEIFGLGIDKPYFANHPFTPSWDMIFKTPLPYKISMLNDPIEAIALSNFYLFGNTDQLDDEKTQKIKELLISQRKSVEAYANFRGDYFLATKNCPVVVASSSYIRRTMRQFSFVDFIVPEEGTFISIENLCIPAASLKEKQAYAFINYIFREPSISSHYKTFGFFPSTLENLSEKDESIKNLIISSPEAFKKYHFIQSLMPAQQMHDLWIEIKTRP